MLIDAYVTPTVFINEIVSSRTPLRIEPAPERVVLVIPTPDATPWELWVCRDPASRDRTRWLLRPAGERCFAGGASAGA